MDIEVPIPDQSLEEFLEHLPTTRLVVALALH